MDCVYRAIQRGTRLVLFSASYTFLFRAIVVSATVDVQGRPAMHCVSYSMDTLRLRAVVVPATVDVQGRLSMDCVYRARSTCLCVRLPQFF